MRNNKKHSLVEKGYRLPFAMVTFFFFLWGFARAILDVLNPFFQETFHINKTQASRIQFVTYLAYFLMAVPAGMLIRRYGTRHGVITGLIAFGGAALAFVLSRFFGDYIFWYYLLLLFVTGCGLACLEVAANPYVTLLGRPETAAGRINRAQSFNGMGCIFGSLLGGAYCFSSDEPNISVPYIFIGIAVLLIAVLFSRVKLPEFVTAAAEKAAAVETADAAADAAAATQPRNLLRHPMFVFGLFALFCYEVAEIAINSFFINYATENRMAEWIDTYVNNIYNVTLNHNFISSIVLSAGLFLFMCGRFAGSWVMRFVRAETILLCCAAITVMLTALVVLDIHTVSFIASVLIFLFESIMFPTIFALSIKGMGSLTQWASAVLMMTPIGGAAGTVLMGMAADYRDMTFSFLVPLSAFIVVLVYASVTFAERRKVTS
ncbi:MAG: MFS transporter [Tannerella sp.]|jgi:FHS family L-fucose permease-like MFS transporter|nr:MFS transporter [Tannerella sp.]